jgi:hypothetical protein
VKETRGDLKSMVREVLSAGGAYVMVVSHASVKQKLAKHEASIRAAVRAAGVPIEDLQVAVRDASLGSNPPGASQPVAAGIRRRPPA